MSKDSIDINGKDSLVIFEKMEIEASFPGGGLRLEKIC